jgi:hypothetical protein
MTAPETLMWLIVGAAGVFIPSWIIWMKYRIWKDGGSVKG